MIFIGNPTERRRSIQNISLDCVLSGRLMVVMTQIGGAFRPMKTSDGSLAMASIHHPDLEDIFLTTLRKANAKNDAAFTKKEMPYEQWLRGGAHYGSREETVYDPDTAPCRAASVEIHGQYNAAEFQHLDHDACRTGDDGRFDWMAESRRPPASYCPESDYGDLEIELDVQHRSGG